MTSEPLPHSAPPLGPKTIPPARAAEPAELEKLVAAIRARTQARLMLSRQGGSYTTRVQVGLRQDHAAAIDAVWRELVPATDWGADFCGAWQILETTSAATTKEEYVRRPDLGRIFSAAAREAIAAGCPAGADLQIVVGDGLSARAAAVQVPILLPLLVAAANGKWTLGRPIFVRHCRVGIHNAVGQLLAPKVVVLLVGERPGLQTSESLSAYLAYRPAPGHTDANRNLVSNIHAAGTSPPAAAERIIALAAELMRCGTSGPAIKEKLATLPVPPPATRLPSS